MSTPPSEAEVRAVSGNELWATCDHAGSQADSHSCPRCGGTLRRCCFTLVGFYAHDAECPEVARRAGEDAT